MPDTKTKEHKPRANGLAAERRSQIFEAATRVFARKGFHLATVQEIADEAGMGKGTIYEYIKSKKDILYFAISEVHERTFEQLEKLSAQNLKPEIMLRRALRIQIDLIEQYKDAARTVIPEVEGMAQKDRESMDRLKELYISNYAVIYEQGVKQGVFKNRDPFATMEVLCNTCMLWGKSDSLRERFKDVRAFENFIVDMYLKGLLK